MRHILMYRIPLVLSLGFEIFRLCAMIFTGEGYQDLVIEATFQSIVLLVFNAFYILFLIQAVINGDGVVTILIAIFSFASSQVHTDWFPIVDMSACILLMLLVVWLECMRNAEHNNETTIHSKHVLMYGDDD